MCVCAGPLLVCVPVITDNQCQIYSEWEKKKWGKKKYNSDWFLSFANKSDILEKFYLLPLPCHLAGRQTAAELNYRLPYSQAASE